MNSAERKGLTHPIVPGVQNIMRVQSEALRSQALIEISQVRQPIPFAALRDRVRAVLGDEKIYATTFPHILTELCDELLISKNRRVFEPTSLGSTAVEAQREYQETLFPIAIANQAEILGEDLAAEMSQQILGNSRRTRTVVPWTLGIAHLQSDKARLNILLALTEGANDFQSLRHTVGSRIGQEDMPQSTLSNLITELERKELLKREGNKKRPEYQLTELGLVSIGAYDSYQERLMHPLADAVRAKLEKDLGITVPTQPRINEALNIYAVPFETMVEYTMRTHSPLAL